jgi:hypothetical protein
LSFFVDALIPPHYSNVLGPICGQGQGFPPVPRARFYPSKIAFFGATS